MPSLLVLLAIVLTEPAGSVDRTALPADCSKPSSNHAGGTPAIAGPKKLADLPPADTIAAVWRFDERGCPSPVVLRPAQGPNPHTAPPLSRP